MGRNTLLSAGSTLLSIVSLVVGVVAVSTPYWATFRSRLSSGSESGHFGAWTVCHVTSQQYRCGQHVSRLQTSGYTRGAGVCGVLAVLLTACACFTSPLVLAMQVTRRQLFVKFRHAVLAKLSLSCAAVTCCLLSLILFGIELDSRLLGESVGYHVNRAWSYYLLVVFALLSFVLCGFAAAEFVLARRLGGDPVKDQRDPSGNMAPVFVNPAVKTLPTAAGRTAPAGNGVVFSVTANSAAGAVVFQRTAAPAPSLSPPRRTPSPALYRSPPPLALLQNGVPQVYDPKRLPGRSSIRRPRPARDTLQQSCSESNQLDGGASEATIIGNPAATAAVPAKKVRIQTLDTPV